MYTNFSSKNIGIFGLGVSGRAAVRFCQMVGANSVVIGRGKPEDWDWKELQPIASLDQDDPESENKLAEMDLIILSPGIPREHQVLSKALEKGVPVVNEIELAHQYFPGKIIGITGTNGKTTTASLIAQCLKQLGQNVFLGGNYGLPFLEWVCDYLEKKEVPVDYAVIELSSFQLESLVDFNADMGIILNITPSHMERYSQFDDYKKAKLNLRDHSKYLIHNGDGIGDETLPDTKERNTYLDQFFDMESFPLEGDYNRDNLWFVAKTLEHFKLPLEKTKLDRLQGEPFRLQKIAANIFNDAKSTNWQATLSAVNALKEKGEITLILGGQNRGEDDLPSEETKQKLESQVTNFIFFGESGIKLKSFISGKYYETLEEVVKNLDLNTIILFSPAYPSFDQFKNYIARGERFNDLIADL